MSLTTSRCPGTARQGSANGLSPQEYEKQYSLRQQKLLRKTGAIHLEWSCRRTDIARQSVWSPRLRLDGVVPQSTIPVGSDMQDVQSKTETFPWPLFRCMMQVVQSRKLSRAVAAKRMSHMMSALIVRCSKFLSRCRKTSAASPLRRPQRSVA